MNANAWVDKTSVSQAFTPLLSTWQSFYVIVGSAVAAVIAIQYAKIPVFQTNKESISC